MTAPSSSRPFRFFLPPPAYSAANLRIAFGKRESGGAYPQKRDWMREVRKARLEAGPGA
jgi:hypothetical protein